MENSKKRNLRHYWDLALVLTQKEIKVRYKGNVLGYLWSIAHPLAFAMVFYIAFKTIMKSPVEDFALFLITALFPWQWYANSINASSSSFVGNASIVKKVSFPRHVLPLALIFNDMFHFILAIPIIVAFMLYYNKFPSIHWTYGIPVLLILQVLFLYGATLIVASLNLFFRDMERLVGIFTMLMFYFTPIIYPAEMMLGSMGKLGLYFIYLNPAAPLMLSWRSLFYDGALIPEYLIACLISGLITAFIGHVTYRRLSPRFAEVL